MGDGYSECVLSHGGLICVSWAQGSSLWFLLLFIRNIILCSSAAGSSRGLCWIMHIYRVTRLNRTFSFFLPFIGHRDPASDCPSHYIWKCCCLWKFIHVFLLAPSFSILQTWWLEKPKRTDTQDAQAEINIYTLYFRYFTTGTECVNGENSKPKKMSALPGNLYLIIISSEIFFCSVLIHNITMKQIIIDLLLLFSLWLKYFWKKH